MPIKLKLDDAELRDKVEDILSQETDTQIQVIGSLIAQAHQDAQKVPDVWGTHSMFGESVLSPHDMGRIRDIIWDLIIEGHLRPGVGDGQNNDLPFVHVTKKGEQYFQGRGRPSASPGQ